MKHYEVVINLRKKNEDNVNRGLKIINIDDLNIKDGYIHFSKDSYNPFGSERRDILNKINSFILSKSNQERAMLLYDISKNDIKFVVRVKDNYKSNVEYLIKTASDFINENITFGTDEEIFVIDNTLYYREISAKEFLIDDLGKLLDDIYDIGEKRIKEFMNIINEPNFKTRELCFRSDILNFDFINSFDVANKLSYDEFLKKYDDVLFNEELKNEIDRIFNSKNENDIKINPVHYEVYAFDSQLRDRMYTCIGEALYNNNRIKKRKAIKLKMDLSSNLVSNDSIEIILNNEEEALVCIEFAEDRGSITNFNQNTWKVGDRRLKELTDIIDRHKDNTQFIFFFDKYQKDMKHEILESLNKITLIRIKDDLKVDRIEEYTDKMLSKKNLKSNEKLKDLIGLAGDHISIGILNNIIDEWQKSTVISEYYPLYEKFNKGICIEKQHIDPYKQLMDMVGLKSVKKVINQIIDNNAIEKIKKKKFIETKKKEIMSSNYAPISMPLHMAFLGNPGTAKTTVATFLSKIFYQKGMLKSDKIVMYNQSIDNIDGAFKKAYGGILFIDEAYQYSWPVFVARLIENMELYRDSVMVILAGYENEMISFINSNPGFESRIKYKVHFDDYTEDELWQILKNLCKDQDLILEDKNIREKLEPVFATSQVVHALGNGRLVRNILDEAIIRKSQRLKKENKNVEDLSYKEINTLKQSDFDIDFETLTGVKMLDIGKEPQKELDNLIGLTRVKELMGKIIASARIIKLKNENEKKDDENEHLIKSPMHLAFLGNPGTAKTTVARLFARILKKDGIIKNPEIVEVGRSDLVSRFVGGTAPLVKSQFMKAKGGILFIDEAYSLFEGARDSFGEEAINTIVQEMENHRNDVIVIFAGYTDRMKTFIENNVGMKSRISYFVEFNDYNASELYKIFEKICKDKKLEFDAKVSKFTKKNLDELVLGSDFKSLGNGRFIRKLVENSELNMNYRVGKLKPEDINKEMLYKLELSDVEHAFDDLIKDKEEEKVKLGFAA